MGLIAIWRQSHIINMDYLNSLLPIIEHFRILGYWIIFFVSLIESFAFIGIVIPGTTFIIFVGFVSAKGFLDLGDAIIFAAAGAIAGDVLSYYLGRHIEKILEDDSKILKSKYLKRGTIFFNKYGGGSVFLGRFVGPIRPVIPFVAGMFKMDKKRFFLWNIFSGFAWAATFLLIGYFFGEIAETFVLWIKRGSVLAGALAGFIFIFFVIRHIMLKKAKIL